MDDSLTKRELELFGRLGSSLPDVHVDVEDGAVGKLHFSTNGATATIDRTEVAAAGTPMDELYKDIELQLRRATRTE